MHIALVQKRPKKEGYYLLRFTKMGPVHLVQMKIDMKGKVLIIPDICPFKDLNDNKDLKCLCISSELCFNRFPNEAWWSIEPIFPV